MAGTLYVVGTPIGNLGDFSPRAIETLKAVDFIAAEDTRVTQKLLNHFEIKKPMMSYYQHNLRERGEEIIARIEAGENCAIVTDAGMPCISDPGEDLVHLCAERGVAVAVVPGPVAAMSALAISGLPTSRFSFEGFLSTNNKNRAEHLRQIRDDRHTLIFYEAPHKLIYTLADMLAALGDRRIALCRELTKLHEEVIRTTFSGALALYKEKSPRGEYVLIIEGAPETEETVLTFEEAVERVKSLREEGLSVSDAAKQVAKETGYKKGDLYRTALQ
ncbi:MAG: 16S rRNA (cytidine(1402)-2'-O)-methyltransferase [Oscillospiraceae bacterium]|nr:16S rRNA (cytidine(1402)-2'-O)-methyltransferase [Oscillospiraceae bacterium]MBQ7083223.1 16S rRNA (cytidine(1402)-2'-O)-methyltransferase [Oscillospiraceae bacterium]